MFNRFFITVVIVAGIFMVVLPINAASTKQRSIKVKAPIHKTSTFVAPKANIGKKPISPMRKPTPGPLHIISLTIPVRRQILYDKKEYNVLEMNMEFEHQKKEKVKGQYRTHVTLDAKTVDEHGRAAWFFNENAMMKIDEAIPYDLATAFFTSTIQQPIGDNHTYTTTFTLHDLIGNQTVQKTVMYHFE